MVVARDTNSMVALSSTVWMHPPTLSPAGFKMAMLRLARGQGDDAVLDESTIRQTTWKLMADRPSLSPAVFDAWNELWVGAALAHDRFIRLEVTQRRDRGDECWEWQIG